MKSKREQLMSWIEKLIDKRQDAPDAARNEVIF